MSEMRLYDTAGNRLYLNAEERAAFLAVARRKPARDRTLCETLLFTGCRPSKLLEIIPARVDLSGSTIVLRSLKKRKDATGAARVIYRTLPVPSEYLDTLNTAQVNCLQCGISLPPRRLARSTPPLHRGSPSATGGRPRSRRSSHRRALPYGAAARAR